MNNLLMYLFGGIIVNLIADMLTSYINAEDLRLTMFERLIILIIWPIAVIYVAAGLLKK